MGISQRVLLVKVVYLVYGPWADHIIVECVRALVVQMMSGFFVYLMGVLKIIKGRKDIISDGLSWVRIEFLVCGGVSQIFFNFAEVKGGVPEAIPLLLLSVFKARTELDPNVLRIDICYEVRLSLAASGGGLERGF